jgi:hypothetical protein
MEEFPDEASPAWWADRFQRDAITAAAAAMHADASRPRAKDRRQVAAPP